jgi:hypothetical protein
MTNFKLTYYQFCCDGDTRGQFTDDMDDMGQTK